MNADRELEYLRGRAISRIYVDFAFGIQFFQKPLNVTIRIEQAVTFIDLNGASTILPEVAEQLAPLLKIFNSTVISAIAKANGTLALDLSQNRKLVVPPHPKYESWEVVADNGLKLICLPGGKLASWAAIKK